MFLRSLRGTCAVYPTDYDHRAVFARHGPDILARFVADGLSQQRAQPVVIDNKSGASGSIGTQIVAHSAPDGLTLLMTPDPPLTTNVFLMKKAPYDPIKDFAPVSEVATGTLALVVHNSIPVDSAQAFVTYVKAHPGEINYASPGVGTPHHLMMEFLKNAAGMEVQHIPFKDAAGAVSNLVGGHVKAAFLPVHVALPLPHDKVRIIGVTSDKRLASAPQVPTLIEQRFPGLEGYIRFGVLAPAGAPPDLVERYRRSIGEIVRSPEATEKLRSRDLPLLAVARSTTLQRLRRTYRNGARSSWTPTSSRKIEIASVLVDALTTSRYGRSLTANR